MSGWTVGCTEDFALERFGLGSSGAIKLGLGDFIFYSRNKGFKQRLDKRFELCSSFIMIGEYYFFFLNQ